ncbi:hypothetical protein EMIHUDRAFT_233793 [Emiliania huxleyi CCMP1516]|uniref:Uncharacterized protein n=2 Tax=Emiliania huxleyi TaxID=2903 RepID=A0A0D3K1D5_EMIH1|nr:hypothetical protein EMIHUDRAFT_233793 [Emiliania huxleyi CCMP1516]EOD29570.1 hypothetical protein EMIHUDRAFT_233793 [Emiliania huxleyi CCMP1516]|eukprot:XP_005781999.1 hypothetical protein EMIHUDRAFT_233793 [Emiliania huxleyi CCMP1516]
MGSSKRSKAAAKLKAVAIASVAAVPKVAKAGAAAPRRAVSATRRKGGSSGRSSDTAAQQWEQACAAAGDSLRVAAEAGRKTTVAAATTAAREVASESTAECFARRLKERVAERTGGRPSQVREIGSLCATASLIAGVCLVLSICGLWGVCSGGRACRWCLALYACVNVLLVLLLVVGTALALAAGVTLDNAQEESFSYEPNGELERSVFGAARGVFQSAYDRCEPSAYLSDAVNDACASGLLNASGGSSCTGNAPGQLSIFCKAPAATQQASLQAALYNPPESVPPRSLSAALNSFDWWASAFCTPVTAEFGAQLHIAAPAAKESSDASKDLFRWATSEAGSGEARDFLDKLVAWTDCYGTQWWREEEGPTAGGGFTPSPELPDSLLSLLGEGEAYSAKMLFCSCGSSNVAVAAAGHLKTTGWVLLGCALCFALIFAVELRLLQFDPHVVICKRKAQNVVNCHFSYF